jgi:hypothetical protein
MSIDTRALWRWFGPRRRTFEWGFWIALYGLNAAANSVVRVLEVEPGDPTAAWEPVIWECSSALAMLLLVWPVVVFTRHWTWSWAHPVRWLGGHLGASVVYSLAHVLLMVGMRELVYALVGGRYDFGHWPSELFYEYLKDGRTYVGLVVLIEGYRFIVRRLAGEARWLDPPPDDLPGAAERDDETYPERFLVKMLGREFLVPAADIDYARAAGNYVNLVVAGREYPLRSTMKSLVDRLDPARFRRVHRSYLVRIDRIAQIEPLEGGDARLMLQDGTVVRCSRSYRAQLT